MTVTPVVAVVVVNWNGKTDTLACLASLSSVRYSDFRTLVVDNGSTDRSVHEIRRRYPELEIVEVGYNSGFAAGANAGIVRALAGGADYVLLLNNDATVESELLTKLVSAATRLHEPTLLNPVIYSASAPSEIWAAGARMASSGVALELVTTLEAREADTQEATEREALLGTALWVDRRIFESIGLLDPDLFLYWEDFDFCSRARKAGYRCCLVPTARIWHRAGASLGSQSPVRDYYDARNRLVWCHRHLKDRSSGSRWRAILWILPHYLLPPVTPNRDEGASALIRNLLLFLPRFVGRCSHPTTRAAVRGIIDYLRGRLGPAPPSIQRLATHARHEP